MSRRQRPRQFVVEEWEPVTKVGHQVKAGEITSIEDLFQLAVPIKEPEIIDVLLPDLQEEVIDINLVQKQTDAGEKSRFKATVIVGNENGFVGIGESKAPEIGPAIRKAILRAKLNVVSVRRGCGSWECGCQDPHSVPFEVKGKTGSVRITLLPAPKGVGLVTADTIKVVLRLAGIHDVWSRTRGHTRTTLNFARSVFGALKETNRIMTPRDWTRREE
ncbi:MAG: 30S ribosomal protein S5 [Candidatus Hermodarchaeota archaeon]